MRSLYIVLLLVAICGAYESPVNLQQAPLVRPISNIGDVIISNVVQVIQEVIPILLKIIQQVIMELEKVLGVHGISKLLPTDILQNSNKYTGQMLNGLDSVMQCGITHRVDIEQTVVHILHKYVSCVENTVPDGGDEQIDKIYDVASKIPNLIIEAYEDIKNCSNKHSNFIMVGVCLGEVALDIELKGTMLIKDIVHLVSRGADLIKVLSSVRKTLTACAGPSQYIADTRTVMVVLTVWSCIASHESRVPTYRSAAPLTTLTTSKIPLNKSHVIAIESQNLVDKADNPLPITLIGNNTVYIVNNTVNIAKA